jgi:hypothetical protein
MVDTDEPVLVAKFRVTLVGDQTGVDGDNLHTER